MQNLKSDISAEGQHEEHTVLRSPVKDVVNKNSTEPWAAQRAGVINKKERTEDRKAISDLNAANRR
ncbi:MAG: hypothetical protein PVJ60_09485 [Phycisphaerales bacterium]|jgi:hypothetical protein